jgi:hypothetical protein
MEKKGFFFFFWETLVAGMSIVVNPHDVSRYSPPFSATWEVKPRLMYLSIGFFMLTATDYRYTNVWQKIRVGTGQYFKWIEGFTT